MCLEPTTGLRLLLLSIELLCHWRLAGLKALFWPSLVAATPVPQRAAELLMELCAMGTGGPGDFQAFPEEILALWHCLRAAAGRGRSLPQRIYVCIELCSVPAEPRIESSLSEPWLTVHVRGLSCSHCPAPTQDATHSLSHLWWDTAANIKP